MLFTNKPYFHTSCYVFVILGTGAYAIGWGAERNGTHIGGIWIQEEAELSINWNFSRVGRTCQKWFSLITYFIMFLSDHARQYFEIDAVIWNNHTYFQRFSKM